MLHGATSSPLEDWAAQRPLFRKAFRLYLRRRPRPCRHQVGRRATVSRSRLLVDDLLAFADALGLDTFHLVGFTWAR